MILVKKRDIVVAVASVCTTLTVLHAANQIDILQSAVFDWNNIPVKETKTGAVRTVFRSKTATLDELECHITTLNPGEASHPPHKHPEEEILVIKEGTVEALVNGQTKQVGAGSVIFQAANQMHAIKNVGTTPATYHVFSWHSPGTMTSK